VDTRTPAPFIEDPTAKRSSARSRGLASTSPVAFEQHGDPRITRGPPPKSGALVGEPGFLSIEATAAYMAESIWTTKDKLRRGVYRAKKSGRRTLVEFESVKAAAAALPDAKFAPPRTRKSGFAK
jgi:hypothetical protein